MAVRFGIDRRRAEMMTRVQLCGLFGIEAGGIVGRSVVPRDFPLASLAPAMEAIGEFAATGSFWIVRENTSARRSVDVLRGELPPSINVNAAPWPMDSREVPLPFPFRSSPPRYFSAPLPLGSASHTSSLRVAFDEAGHLRAHCFVNGEVLPARLCLLDPALVRFENDIEPVCIYAGLVFEGRPSAEGASSGRPAPAPVPAAAAAPAGSQDMVDEEAAAAAGPGSVLSSVLSATRVAVLMLRSVEYPDHLYRAAVVVTHVGPGGRLDQRVTEIDVGFYPEPNDPYPNDRELMRANYHRAPLSAHMYPSADGESSFLVVRVAQAPGDPETPDDNTADHVYAYRISRGRALEPVDRLRVHHEPSRPGDEWEERTDEVVLERGSDPFASPGVTRNAFAASLRSAFGLAALGVAPMPKLRMFEFNGDFGNHSRQFTEGAMLDEVLNRERATAYVPVNRLFYPNTARFPAVTNATTATLCLSNPVGGDLLLLEPRAARDFPFSARHLHILGRTTSTILPGVVVPAALSAFASAAALNPLRVDPRRDRYVLAAALRHYDPATGSVSVYRGLAYHVWTLGRNAEGEAVVETFARFTAPTPASPAASHEFGIGFLGTVDLAAHAAAADAVEEGARWARVVERRGEGAERGASFAARPRARRPRPEEKEEGEEQEEKLSEEEEDEEEAPPMTKRNRK